MNSSLVLLFVALVACMSVSVSAATPAGITVWYYPNSVSCATNVNSTSTTFNLPLGTCAQIGTTGSYISSLSCSTTAVSFDTFTSSANCPGTPGAVYANVTSGLAGCTTLGSGSVYATCYNAASTLAVSLWAIVALFVAARSAM